MQTRKRVSRACDECRVRKARCDGIDPCEACQRRSRGWHPILWPENRLTDQSLQLQSIGF